MSDKCLKGFPADQAVMQHNRVSTIISLTYIKW